MTASLSPSMPRTRAPAGSNKPILMRLTTAERAELERHAAVANMTLAATARRMTLCGLAQLTGGEDPHAVIGVPAHE